jgi:protein arginine kinase activator
MKCQRCSRPATLHITEVLPGDRFDELHLCEECGNKHLHAPDPPKAKAEPVKAADPADRKCSQCGLKFVEFRSAGRLGCPHDYDAFRDDLVPLLEGIHGDTTHQGKRPRRQPHAEAARRELAALRGQLGRAVEAEDYEEAARLRDRIRRLDDG